MILSTSVTNFIIYFKFRSSGGFTYIDKPFLIEGIVIDNPYLFKYFTTPDVTFNSPSVFLRYSPVTTIIVMFSLVTGNSSSIARIISITWCWRVILLIILRHFISRIN